MNSLREGLKAAGLVSEKEIGQFERQKETANKDMRHLSWAKSIQEFSRAANNVLTIYPEEIEVVIEAARCIRVRKGRGQLLWQLYQIRSHLPRLETSGARRKFLDQALGENGSGYLAVMQGKLHGDW